MSLRYFMFSSKVADIMLSEQALLSSPQSKLTHFPVFAGGGSTSQKIIIFKSTVVWAKGSLDCTHFVRIGGGL